MAGSDGLQVEQMLISPRMAGEWLRVYRPDWQRPLSEGRWRSHRECLERGEWLVAPITLHTIEECGGRTVLSDGQHRLMAVSQWREPVPFLVIRQRVRTEREARLAYEAFDLPVSTRHLPDLFSTAQLREHGSLTKNQLMRLSSATKFIACEFELVPAVVRQSMGFRSNRRLLEMIADWQREGETFFGWARGTSPAIMEVVVKMAVLGVALVTIREAQGAAERFWPRLLQNDGLCKGEPEHTLLQALLRPVYLRQDDPCYGARLVAGAWNAAYERRELYLLKVMDRRAPLRLLGTRFMG